MKTMYDTLSALMVVGLLSFSAHTDATESVYDPVSMDPPKLDAEYPPSLHELLIPSHGMILSGVLLDANGKGPHATVLLLHGYPGNEKNIDLAQSLRRAGFNVLYFHFRGAWGSQGDYSIFQQVDDVTAVFDYVNQNADSLRVNAQKISVIGHSLGGFTALRSAAAHKEMVCVVGLAAANLGEWDDTNEQKVQGFSAYTDQQIMLNNYNGSKALAELSAYAKSLDVRDLADSFTGRSVLLITGEADTSVPVDVQARIVAAYEQTPGINLTAEVIPGDHSFSGTRIRMQRMVIAWMEQNCR